MDEPLVWACKQCTFVQTVQPNVYECHLCGHDHSEDSDVLAINPRQAPPAPGPESPPTPLCEPEECKEFPKTVDKDYLRKYYRHNLSNSISAELAIPADTINFIVHYIEEGYSVGDNIEVLDTVQKWYFSTVVDIKPGEIKVHYEGWSPKFDEWIKIGSNRIAPLLTHTNGKPYKRGGEMLPTANSNTPNLDYIAQLVGMGFTEIEADAALRTHGNNLESALNSLL
jgi:hypothetical protein